MRLTTLRRAGAVVAALACVSTSTPAGAEPTTQQFSLMPTPARPDPDGPVDVSLQPATIRFGINAEGVAKIYDRYWEKRFVPLYRRANPGPKTRELDHRLAQRKKLLRRVAEFDGISTTFDDAEFRGEFAHGNRETMTSAPLVARLRPGGRQVRFTRRFFFHRDHLWKVYDEFELGPESPLGAKFDEAVRRIEAGLGKSAARTRAPADARRSVTWVRGGERIRVVELPKSRLAVVHVDAGQAARVLARRPQPVEEPPGGLEESVRAVLK